MTITSRESSSRARAALPALDGVPVLRLSMAAAVAAAVTITAWQTGDWWDDGFPGSSQNLTVTRLLLFLTIFGAIYTAQATARRSSVSARWIFAIWVAYFTFWLIGTWPGIIMTDTVDVVSHTRGGIVYEWFSYLHSLINLAAFDIVPHVAVLGVLQIVATAGLMAYASSLVLRTSRGRGPVIAMNLIAAASAPLVVNTILYSRDTLFGVLHVFLALYVADAVAVRRSLSRKGLIGIAFLVAFLSVYRGDGVALVLAVPAILLLLRPSRRMLAGAAATFATALLVLHVLLPATLSIQDRPNAYELSLRLNPLGAVLQSDFYSETKEADLAQLSRVIDVDAARRVSTPLDIPVLWEGHWNQEASDADFAAFGSVADRLFRDNLGTVLGNRMRTFGATTGLAPGAFTATAMGEIDDRHDWIADRTAMTGSPPSRALYSAQANILRNSGSYLGLFSFRAALQWNFLPWLFLLGATLLAYRRLPFAALFAAIILSRVPLVFLAAPAAQFKYYYSVELGGIVLFGFLLACLRRYHLQRLIPPALTPRPAR